VEELLRAEQALSDLEQEVVAAARLISDLERENADLRARLTELEQGLSPERRASARAQSEWQRLQAEREALAERLKVILGKFQWLEQEASRP
jgi:FtsZ-binding cell division protein ZapB